MLVGFGLVCVGIGGVGIFVPLLPTTPFVLLAAVAFAKSSERLHCWLLNHRVFGRLIRNWRDHGAISRPTKWVSGLSMIAILLISVALNMEPWIILVQAAVLSCSAAYVLSRPEPPTVDA